MGEMTSEGANLGAGIDLSQFYQVFFEEAGENLDRMEQQLLEIDIDGARQVRRTVPGALLVFLAPPSREELARRLTGRGTEPPDVIARRLEVARQEIEAGREFDITLVNTSVQDVCRQLVTLMTA